MWITGCAQVSKEHQLTARELNELRCRRYQVFEEKATGTSRARPDLSSAFAEQLASDGAAIRHLAPTIPLLLS